jgi:type I restriction enzyme S subunit
VDLPSGWTTCLLIDACDIVAGQSPESQYYNQDGRGLPFFQGKADFSKIFPTNRVYCTKPSKTAISGDVLLSVRAPVGPTNLARQQVAIGRGINAIRPLGDISSWFVLYFFRSIEPVLSGVGTGTTFKAVTVDEVRSIKLRLPPLAEQHRIVEKIDALFSELDKGVEYLQTIKQQLKTYRQAVLKWAFEGKLEELAGISLSEESITKFFQVSGGLTKNSKRDILDLKMPYLRVANVYYNELDLREVKTIGVTELEANRTSLQKGDLLFVEGNGSKEQIGRVAIWNNEIGQCLHQNHIIKCRPTGRSMKSKYALYYLMSKTGRDQILAVASSTSGLYTLSINKIKGLTLPFCSEQQRVIDAIEMRLSVCGKLEQFVDDSLLSAEALRQSILKKAFEGRLVPQDPNDEPAEKLLERIRAERTTQTSPAQRRQKNVR